MLDPTHFTNTAHHFWSVHGQHQQAQTSNMKVPSTTAYLPQPASTGSFNKACLPVLHGHERPSTERSSANRCHASERRGLARNEVRLDLGVRLHRVEGGLLGLGVGRVGGAGGPLGEDLLELQRRAAVGVRLARALERRQAVAVLDGRVGACRVEGREIEWLGLTLGVANCPRAARRALGRHRGRAGAPCCRGGDN